MFFNKGLIGIGSLLSVLAFGACDIAPPSGHVADMGVDAGPTYSFERDSQFNIKCMPLLRDITPATTVKASTTSRDIFRFSATWNPDCTERSMQVNGFVVHLEGTAYTEDHTIIANEGSYGKGGGLADMQWGTDWSVTVPPVGIFPIIRTANVTGKKPVELSPEHPYIEFSLGLHTFGQVGKTIIPQLMNIKAIPTGRSPDLSDLVINGHAELYLDPILFGNPVTVTP